MGGGSSRTRANPGAVGAQGIRAPKNVAKEASTLTCFTQWRAHSKPIVFENFGLKEIFCVNNKRRRIIEEQTKEFVPLFILIGVALVAATSYISVFHVEMPTRDLSGHQRTFGWVYDKVF